MTKTIIRFIGGPRGGKMMQKTKSARIPTYVDSEGETLSLIRGDRIKAGRRVGEPSECYVLSSDTGPKSTDVRVVTYKFIRVG